MKVSLTIVFLGFSISLWAQDIAHYVGYAYDREIKQLIYTDTYQEKRSNNHLYASAIYRNKKNQIIAEKYVTFNQQLSVPSFYFKNHITGVIASVNVQSEVINVAYRPSFLKDFSKAALPIKPTSVIDAGFHYYVLQHWDSLLEGQKIAVSYIAPSRGTDIALSLTFSHTYTNNKQSFHVFTVTAQSFLVRLFFPPIVLHYNADTKKLFRFEGLSNIKLGKNPSHVKMDIKHLNNI